MRLFLFGLWVVAASTGSTFAGSYWRLHRAASTHEGVSAKVEVKKLRPITVPIIAGGSLKGYVSGDFSVVLDPDKTHGGVDPEVYVADEAFKLLYSHNDFNFAHMQKLDLSGLSRQITANVNARLGAETVRETLVKNFTFISKEDLPR